MRMRGSVDGHGNTVCGSGRLLRLGKPERFVMPATRRRTVRMVRKARRGGESRWRRGWRLLRTQLDGQEHAPGHRVSSSSSAWGGPCLQDHASCVRACVRAHRSSVFWCSGGGYGFSVICSVVSREVALATGMAAGSVERGGFARDRGRRVAGCTMAAFGTA